MVSVAEQETIICIERDENIAHISTSDNTMKTKLDKRVEANPDEWKVVEDNGDFKFYECPKKYISFRSKTLSRDLTDEQRAELAERARRVLKRN